MAKGKRINVKVLGTLLLLASIALCAETASAQITPGEHVNTELGYRIQVPEGWTGMELGGNLILYEGSMAQGVDKDNTLILNLTSRPATEQLQQSWNSSVLQFDEERTRELFQQNLPEKERVEYDIQSVQAAEVAGQAGVAATVRVTTRGRAGAEAEAITFMSRIYMLVHEGRHYILGYVIPESKWGEMEPWVGEHMTSFRLE